MNAAKFNALYEVGVPVFAYPGARPEDIPSARRLVTRTRSRAELFCGHTDVVWVDDHSACIALSHVDVVTEDEWKAAKEAEAEAVPSPVATTSDRLTPERESEIAEHLAATENWSIGNLAARDLLAELAAVRAELAARTEDVAFLERATLPELRRTIQHHIDGKQRWRARAESAEARVSAVLDLCDREQRNAMRWENPIPAPEWVATVQKLALGDAKSAEEAGR